jgi:hypothetical protein
MPEYPNGQHAEPPRSPHWPHVEKAVLHLHPFCACCGKDKPTKGLQVHHVIPFHFATALGRPDLELDPRNLIVLCETEHNDPEANHHLAVGHLGNFKSAGNLHAFEDAEIFAGMTAEQIEKDRRWLARKATMLPDLDKMTDDQKAAFRALMDATVPLQSVAA